MTSPTVIEQFYSSFQQKNAEGMTEHYIDTVVFEDPAFGRLYGERAKAMWTMLCKNATDLKIEYDILEEDDSKAKVRWQAFYTFRQTGRKVHNIIEATFLLKEEKIISHQDNFDLHKWAGQAMGLKGRILGGTAFFKKKLQQQTNRLLDKFIGKNNA